MLRTPKERFLTTAYSGQWGKVVAGEVFEEAVHSALAQLANELPLDCPVPQQACDAYQQMVGARKYMEILSSLSTPQTTTKTTQPKGLDYSSGV